MNDMMGKKITVTMQFNRTRKGSWRRWEVSDIIPRSGWLVGFRTIWDGYMDSGIGTHGEQIGGGYFVNTTHHRCALVSFSSRENAVRVPLDGFTEE